MKRPELDGPKPIIYTCRWRHGPGNFCDVHVDEPLTMCAKHKAENRKRLAALRKERTA